MLVGWVAEQRVRRAREGKMREYERRVGWKRWEGREGEGEAETTGERLREQDVRDTLTEPEMPEMQAERWEPREERETERGRGDGG